MSGAGLRVLKADDPSRIGPYRLMARLGAGGMGQVYLGRSQGRRLVAVKVVHPHFADNAVFRRRFAKEVAAARRIGGFYTARVVDADTGADPPWLVTEYITGPSLQSTVAEHGPLPAASVAALGAGLAEGLEAVHEQNVIHRDLKPGNVLLAQDGPRIIDFGIAHAMDATSQSVTAVGTPGYMAPELFLGREIGPPGDVFGLAALLAFAATGRPPFGTGPAAALGYRIRHEEPDLTGVPASLRPLIAAGLAKDPDDRPGVAEFLDGCSAHAAGAAGESMMLETLTTMIATRVAETEEFAGRADRDEQEPHRPRGEREQSTRTLEPPQRPEEPEPPQRPEQAERPSAPAEPPGRPGGRPAVRSLLRTGAGYAAAIAGLLLVAGLIALTAEDDASSAGAASAPDASAEAATRSPPPAAVRAAFEGVSVGDCLDAHKDPYDSTKWSEHKPNTVPCHRSYAYLKVYGVERASASCDADARDAETWWRSPGGDGERIYLCVRRHFRKGDCFLGLEGDEEGRVAVSGHAMLVSWRCGAIVIPGKFEYILQFIGHYKNDCPSGSRTWKGYRDGVLCARVV